MGGGARDGRSHGGHRSADVMSVRELIGALSALEDARRQYEGRSVAERRVAREIAAREAEVLDELRRRRGDHGEAAVMTPAADLPTLDPDPGGVSGASERERRGEG